jgi:hypothetical protein
MWWFIKILTPRAETNNKLVSTNKNPVQIVYRSKKDRYKHEILMEYDDVAEAPYFVERENMVFVPYRIRHWNTYENKWPNFWEETK